MLVDLPAPSGPPGREQFGFRPAVIIQNDFANLQTVVVVPLTSNKSATKFAGSFLIAQSGSNRLDCDSVILTGQVHAIDRKRIKQQIIGALDAEDLLKLENELRHLLCL